MATDRDTVVVPRAPPAARDPLLRRPRGEEDHLHPRNNHPAVEEHDLDTTATATDRAQALAPALARPTTWSQFIKSWPFSLRLSVLVFLFVVGYSLIAAWSMHVPLAVGRLVLATVGFKANHDGYSVPAGVAACWAILYIVRFVLHDVLTNRDNYHALARTVGKWAVVAVKVQLLPSHPTPLLPHSSYPTPPHSYLTPSSSSNTHTLTPPLPSHPTTHHLIHLSHILTHTLCHTTTTGVDAWQCVAHRASLVDRHPLTHTPSYSPSHPLLLTPFTQQQQVLMLGSVWLIVPPLLIGILLPTHLLTHPLTLSYSHPSHNNNRC